MHCLLGACFMLLQEAEPLAPNEFFVKQHSLPEIFTLFSSSFLPGSNLQYCRGLAPVKQMRWGFFVNSADHGLPRFSMKLAPFYFFLIQVSSWAMECGSSGTWKTVLFLLSPFHSQGLWKLGCLKQPKFPPWLYQKLHARELLVMNHQLGDDPWQSRTAVLKGPIIPCYSSHLCPVCAQFKGLGLSRAAA